MARSSDDRAVELDEFFEGVDAMRARLDRHLHDPARSRERLSQLVAKLLEPRTARGLARWLTEHLGEALGARCAELWVWRDGWERWSHWGERQGDGPPEDLDRDAGWLPLPGADGRPAVVWLDPPPRLDEASSSLLEAIADTAGVALEQAIHVEALADRGAEPQKAPTEK